MNKSEEATHRKGGNKESTAQVLHGREVQVKAFSSRAAQEEIWNSTP